MLDPRAREKDDRETGLVAPIASSSSAASWRFVHGGEIVHRDQGSQGERVLARAVVARTAALHRARIFVSRS